MIKPQGKGKARSQASSTHGDGRREPGAPRGSAFTSKGSAVARLRNSEVCSSPHGLTGAFLNSSILETHPSGIGANSQMEHGIFPRNEPLRWELGGASAPKARGEGTWAVPRLCPFRRCLSLPFSYLTGLSKCGPRDSVQGGPGLPEGAASHPAGLRVPHGSSTAARLLEALPIECPPQMSFKEWL